MVQKNNRKVSTVKKSSQGKTSKLVGRQTKFLSDGSKCVYEITKDDDGTTHYKKTKYVDDDKVRGITGKYDKDWLKNKASEFRRELISKATKTEIKLYDGLVGADIDFEFQKIIFMERSACHKRFYIVDFYIPEKNLIVEIDGPYHNEVSSRVEDFGRKMDLEISGYRILRFTNSEVYKDDDKCRNIISRIMCYEK